MAPPLQLTFVSYIKNSYIILEGKANTGCFFIIQKGQVALSRGMEIVEEEQGKILNPGDFFGVLSTMSGHSYIETARALTDVTLISVRKDQYGQLIQNNTPVAMKIISQFSRRMRFLDQALTRLTLKDNALEDISQIYKVGEYYAKQSLYSQAYYALGRYLACCPKGLNVNKARELMVKIAPYAASVQPKGADEFNRIYPKDCMLFSEGEPGDELFIIQSGSVKIVKIADNNEVLLSLLKPGDIFGEMALLESKPRVACAVAHDECQVMVVNRANFEQMVGTNPQIVARLTTLLAERIWFIYKQLANTMIIDPIGRMYDYLQIILEKNKTPVSRVSYTFDFGPKELSNMVGLPLKEGGLVLRKFRENDKIQIVKKADKERLHITDILEIVKQADYYRKMDKIEKSRRNLSLAVI